MEDGGGGGGVGRTGRRRRSRPRWATTEAARVQGDAGVGGEWATGRVGETAMRLCGGLAAYAGRPLHSALFMQFFAEIDVGLFCGAGWRLSGPARPTCTPTQEQAGKDMIEGLRTLEAELGDKKYFGGDTFGFVDNAFVPFTSWFHTYEKLGNFSVEEHCPTIVAWAKRCKERDSVAKALTDPEKVYEFVVSLREKFGAK